MSFHSCVSPASLRFVDPLASQNLEQAADLRFCSDLRSTQSQDHRLVVSHVMNKPGLESLSARFAWLGRGIVRAAAGIAIAQPLEIAPRMSALLLPTSRLRHHQRHLTPLRSCTVWRIHSSLSSVWKRFCAWLICGRESPARSSRRGEHATRTRCPCR